MGKKSTYGATGRGDVLNFPPEILKVITDERHALFDSRVNRAPDESMVLSIMREGVLEPLIVTRDGEDVYVLAGRQRRSAAIEANKRFKAEGRPPIAIPCIWKRGDDASLFEVMVTENEVRSGDSPIERAKKMQRLLDFGRDEAQIAVVFGCTTATVKNHLALLECAPSVKKAVESGQIAATIATKMAKLSREEQDKALEKMIAEGATKGTKARKIAAKEGTKAAKPALSVKVRDRVHAALTNGATKDLGRSDQIVANVAAITLAFVSGQLDAFEDFPAVAAVIAEAMNKKDEPKGKKSKGKKAAKAAQKEE